MAIHIYACGGPEDPRFEVWTDCEPGHYNTGRCLAVESTLDAARAEAQRELESDLRELTTGHVLTLEDFEL